MPASQRDSLGVYPDKGRDFDGDYFTWALILKVIKRMAYGYRDDAYFFLRIRAAFPGIR